MGAGFERTVARGEDGTFHGRVYVTTTSGIRKRVSVYGKTRDEVRQKITELQAQDNQGIPVPDTAPRWSRAHCSTSAAGARHWTSRSPGRPGCCASAGCR